MIPVAGYCRVSTDKDDQANSFQTQQQYFREYIERHPDWSLYEIYADEGITGTSTKKRIRFNRMIQDAYEGKFRLILTKEVSRFSRNILDTIAYTRELKAIGVGVLFVTDRINTMDPEAEMLLSFLASLAQEESRRTSGRVVWGQTRQMEKGVVFGPSLLGYDVRNGIITVNPEGAEIVRLIFHKYAVEQTGTAEIARFLTTQGCRTYRGSTEWNSAAVIKILHNEKYVGDLVQKKTYTPDFLTHEKRRNNGVVPLVSIKNHHEPIITRELWSLTQERLQRNNKHSAIRSGHSNRYAFSGKIRCGVCGAGFVGRFRYRKDGTKLRRWSCAAAARGGQSVCKVGKLVRDDDAMQMLKTAVNRLQFDKEAVVRNVTALAVSAILAGEAGVTDDPNRLRYEIRRVKQKKEAVMDSFFDGDITKEDMQTMNQRYENRLASLQERLTRTELALQEERDTASLNSALQNQIRSILCGETESTVFVKTILRDLTVFQDRHMELRLNHLPHVFRFIG